MDFWDEEYAAGNLPEDWFFEYDDMDEGFWRELVAGRVLVIGCGRSTLSEKLRPLVEKVVSIDSSACSIADRREENYYFVCDARRIELPDGLSEDGTYDTVVDKGCLDALLAYREDEEKSASRAAVAEVRRVLRENGRFVVITCTREPGEDRDGYGGGHPRAAALLKDAGFGIERREVKAPRPLAPTFADVRPTHYAVVIGTKVDPHLADYFEYYDSSPEPHDAFASWGVLGGLVRRYLPPTPRILEVGATGFRV
ncbi:hypothetical protein CTAYLR_001721 [Chrysophaeum taylorii]|uniref:Methyltransferase domain-containing protein n=1 Tax=Chrysophaeum taylorii TaxID=2483200 RepID=A0AAD7U7A7_9STRA|nr:hypothetical protein CTAYLR_001721 [Chrysophaeum taylorii]